MAQASPKATAERDTSCKPILVLGLGNLLLRDEGVGVRAIEYLRALALPAEVELFDGGTAGLDLVEVIAGRDLVIVIDAVDMQKEPGSFVRLGPEDFGAAGWGGVSAHDLGFLEALAVAKLLNYAPRQVIIYGIQPGCLDFGFELSEPVAVRMPEIVQAVVREIEVAAGHECGAAGGGGERV